MELYFKDLDSSQTDETLMHAGDELSADLHEDTAEDIAFAELSDRVYAAGLVY
ncbi:MAG: hypothetical protein ABI831_14075 [Betaproteobacteria bacterium]